ncbi:hypothetical protein ACFV4M_03630 [Kitasatospora indigofera]|uniref:hypothetical protein n=1 Tax=Kitasatospora indigofera TaxID=67307 RepID=UPI003668212B
MTVFHCARCGARLSEDLTALADVPAKPAHRRVGGEARRAPSTVPRGHYAVDPDPWGAPYLPLGGRAGARPAGEQGLLVGGGSLTSAGPRNTVLVHPEDVMGLEPLPGGGNGGGCCGPTGTEGPNRACTCGVRLATLSADCLGPYELHLDPVRVYAVEGAVPPPAGVA